MSSLTSCLKKVGAVLSADDKAAVLARAGVLRGEGLSATDAGRQAVDERLAEVQGQIKQVQPLVPEPVDPLNTSAQPVQKTPESEQVGDASLSEVVATHKDPGEPAEPATAAVVKESLAKAADNRNRKPSEMRAELLAMIDKAMAEAPDEDTANEGIFVGLAKTRMGQLEISGHRKFGDRTVAVDARRGSDDNWKVVDSSYDGSGTGRKRNRAIGTLTGGGETARAQLVALLRRIDVDGNVSPPDTVTLKVPGDGTFKVLNTRQRLEEFRKKVEKSPGFKDTATTPEPVARTGKYGEPFGVERGSSGPKSAIEGMIDSGDPQAAVDYAAARGLVLADVLKGDTRRLPKVANLTPTAEALGEFEPAEMESGPFGPILRNFRGDAQGAIKALTKLQDGEAVAALNHPEVGDIDLVWGKEGTRESNGFGLAKLIKWHPEVLDDLQGVISSLKVVERNENRVQLESDKHRAAVRLEWDQQAKHWLLTAFEKKAGGDTRTDTAANVAGGDTARPGSGNGSVPTGAKGDKAGTVENFGEALPPARRTMAAKLTEDLADEDIANRPLSEIWPLKENEAIEDTFAAAVAHAARAEVPAKPRQPHKLRQYVEKVKMLRSLAGRIVSGEVTRERMAELIERQYPRLKHWWAKVRVLETVSRDQWKRIESVEEYPDAFNYVEGQQVAAPHLGVRIDGRSHWLRGDVGAEGKARGTVDGNRAGLMALIMAAEPEQRMQFEIRQVTRTGEVFINKAGDPERRRLMTFATVAEARTALNEQYEALVGAWEATKARDNITERDLRSAENRPRVGSDHRAGKDVTPQQFQDAFGFRGGEFGKWVAQGKGDKERQALLNSTYDALMDLAALLDVPPRAMSLNGTLGIALGSRGSGWASAHFEPSNLVINLTKTRGAGTLAHEWFHALDNYFSRLRRNGEEATFTGDQKKYRDDNFITHRPEALMVRRDRSRRFAPMTATALEALRERRKHQTDEYSPEKWERDPSTPDLVRPEVEARFAALVQALKDSPMAKRAALLDKGNGYWSRTLEVAARAFESYVIARMHEQGYHNDFLVNVTKLDDLGGKDPERYPYLLPGEVKPIADAFDALFGTIKTRDGEGGKTVLYSRRGSGAVNQPQTETAAFRRWFGDSKVVDAEGRPLVVYHGSGQSISEFEPGRRDPGVWFTSRLETAAGYAKGDQPTIHDVYLSAMNPLVVDFSTAQGGEIEVDGQVFEDNVAIVKHAQRKGYDSVNFPVGNFTEDDNTWVVFRPEQIKSSTGNNGNFDPANPDIRMSRMALPPAAIGGSLARVNNHPDYAAAKAGDVEAAYRLASDLVTDGFVAEVRELTRNGEAVLLPVVTQEAGGRDKIALAVAEVLAERLGVETDLRTAQATRPQPVSKDPITAILQSPEFYGTVTTGRRYVLVDSGLGQGTTLAAMARHIEQGGGEVAGVAALSGKRRNAQLVISNEQRTQLQERFGDLEPAFRAAAGFGLDGLTSAEASSILDAAPEQVRNRIADEGRAAGFKEDARTDGQGSNRRLSNETPRERFRRLLGVPSKGIPLAQARQLAQAYTDAGLRSVNVAATPADLPADLRRRLEGAADDVRGAYFPDRDQTWVFSDRVNDPEEFAFVVLHEAFHRGLGKTFGREARRIMGQMYATNRRLRERADKVAADLKISRDEAIEEALADMAAEGKAQKLRGWAKLVAMIRGWLGKVMDAVGLRMEFTDDQIETFVAAMAREGLMPDARVTTGEEVGRMVAASVPARPAQTETAAFRRWFGDSKVVDAEGRPLVVYHGTTADLSAFDLAFSGSDGVAYDRPAIFATDDATLASDYARNKRNRNIADAGRVFQRFKNENPGVYDDEYERLFDAYKAAGRREGWDIGVGANVLPLYLSIQNPLVVDGGGQRFMQVMPDAVKQASEQGRDGVIVRNVIDNASPASDYPATVYVAFRPEQIKSAIGNNGQFDPANPDIRFSRRASTSLPAQAAAQGINIQSLRNAVMDRFQAAGAKVSWWDKTLGTQFDKAKRLPAFGKVFDRVQQYLEDTSTLANEAADQAPSILPKLDSVRDVWDAAKRGLSTKDREAIKAPIFEGTLILTRQDGKLIKVDDLRTKADGLSMEAKAQQLLRDGHVTAGELASWNALPLPSYEGAVRNRYESAYLDSPGVVFTPEELRSLYKLTDAQIKQYQEFRAAVNTSLDQVVATDALRMLGTVAELPEELHRAAVDDRDGFRAALGRLLDARIEAGGDEADVNALKQLRGDMESKYAKVDALKARGYAPLMRFGQYAVSVPGQDGGDMDFFALYETKAEANAAARSLNELPEFRGRVEQSTMSQEAYKLFAQVPLESLEMFAEAIGAEQSEVFQDYLRMAKNNRSALKRLIQRKGIAGYNEDVSRVLASFVTSNARMASGTVNLAQAKEAAEGIKAGDVKDEAIRLIETVQDPTETAGPLRGLMFVNFIGGSIASALVNVTQPVMMTTPYLSQWGGMAKASARLLAASRLAAGGKIVDKELAEALRRAEKDGIVSPQEIHHLTAEAMQTFGSNPWMKRLAFLWGSPFSLAEQFNRRVTFLAAYQTAKAEGMAEPFAFAEKAVIETQGLYNKGNASNWARNPIGAVALTFKQYSIHYLEWLRRMWNTGAPGSPERTAGRKAVLFALAMLMLAGGVEGLPFAEDLNDLADTFMQAAGIDTSAKGWKRDFFANTLGLGDEGADVVMRGFSAVGGVPMDVSMRMGMGNLLPGTGIWLRSNTDVSRDVLELAGPAGSLLGQVKDAGQKALEGDAAGAAKALLPVALRNAKQGWDMMMTGEHRDTKNRKVMDTDEMDAAMKLLGFQPAEVARESSQINLDRRRVQLTRNVESKITDLWAQGLRERDPDMVQEARQELLEWNQSNPQSRIAITNAQVLKRLKDMQASRAERFQRAAPKELRQGLAVQ